MPSIPCPDTILWTPLFRTRLRRQGFPIGQGQTISQPYTVAFQTQLLEVEKMIKSLK